MTQAIIFTNDNGGVSVCTPTGELTINEVLAKDCPVGAIIVDDSTLPQGADAEFFNAWELNGLTITVNLEKARTIKLNQFNTMALQTAQKRQLNTLAGIPNNISDADFLNELAIGRADIAKSTTTTELALIANPT